MRITTFTPQPGRAQSLTRRVLLLVSFAGAAAGVYACSDGTAPTLRSPTARPPVSLNATVVTPGVVTLCKVGPGASFDVQVGLGAPVQPMAVREGSCATLPTITAAPGDDVIVTIREKPEAYYALDHVVLQHGEGEPQTISGTSSVSFEGVHGANVTFYNVGVVRVCKDGTNATFQYEIGLGAGFHGLSLMNGQCSDIARIPPVYPDDMVVTIREDASPSYRLNHITFAHGDLAPMEITGQTGLGFEGSHGAVLVFHNDPVDRGCTYTQGWYKNKGSAALPAGTFYSSGATWLTILDTPPQGNAYYILARQFIAASLNVPSAPPPAAVSTALNGATAYFAVATPANWSAGGSYTKAKLTAWADLLGAYNEGMIGPGHCE